MLFITLYPNTYSKRLERVRCIIKIQSHHFGSASYNTLSLKFTTKTNHKHVLYGCKINAIAFMHRFGDHNAPV